MNKSHFKLDEEKPVTSITYKIYNKNNNQILQPELRFKARTKIERIFEEINKTSDRKLDKKVIDNQMREIQSRKMLKSQESSLRMKEKSNNENKQKAKQIDFFSHEDNNEIDIDDYLNKLSIQKTLEKKAKNSNINDKSSKLSNRNKESNQEAKQILEDLHHKTHFKAVSTIANYYRDRGISELTKIKKIFKNYYSQILFLRKERQKIEKLKGIYSFFLEMEFSMK